VNAARAASTSAVTMNRAVVAIVALAALAAQKPYDESDLPEAERRIPPGHYCKRPDVPIGPAETRAHHCACKYSCRVDEAGNVIEHESPDCLSFCHKNGRKCTCHPEGDPAVTCEGQPSDAWVDMDGQLVAVRIHHR
jgi:hypothetical protein